MMWVFIIPAVSIGLVAWTAYRLGLSVGWNQAVDRIEGPCYDLYDKAFDNGYSKGYDDGSAGLDGAVAALRAWGDDCQPD